LREIDKSLCGHQLSCNHEIHKVLASNDLPQKPATEKNLMGKRGETRRALIVAQWRGVSAATQAEILFYV